jgi:hypothetical protein
MSRETDWHVFDKAVEVTAMAVRGSAANMKPAEVADVFREVHQALKDAADAMDSNDRTAGF